VKETFCDCTPDNFWSKEVISKNCYIPRKLLSVLQIITVCVYLLCQSAFLKKNSTKNTFRICMTNENLHHCPLRAVATLEQKFK